MGRPEGESTAYQTNDDQQPQEYDLHPQEYQYETATNSETHNGAAATQDDDLTPNIEINRYVNSTPQQEDQYQPQDTYGNDPHAQFQPQPQQHYRPSPAPPAGNQPYGAQAPPRPAMQYPPQNLQNNPLYLSQQGQQQATNNIANQPAKFPPQPHQYQQQQPANWPPPQNSPLHPMYHNNVNNNSNTTKPVAFPPPQVPNQMPQAYPPQAAPQGYNQVGASNNYHVPQPQASPFHPQVGVQGYNNNIPASPHKPNMVLANMAAPGIPVQMTQPGQPMAYNEGWRTGLFDCMDDPMNAIITCLFPCLTFGQVAEIVDNGYTSCSTSGLLYGLIASFIGMPCIMSCGYRSKLRAKFGLVESPAPDWVVHFFCEQCALCQEYRELNKRGWDPSIGWQGNVARQNMQQAQVAMMPPMHQNMMA